jgi:selenocysteine-specific elongation factor
VRLLGQIEHLKAGECGFCQLVPTEPVLVLRGDRFILRDETARRTLGGGVILNPWPAAHRASDRAIETSLAAFESGDPTTVVETFVEGADEFAVSIDELSMFLNTPADRVSEIIQAAAGLRVFELGAAAEPGGAEPATRRQRLITTARKMKRAADDLVAALTTFHRDQPLAPGMDIEAARGELSVRLFRALVDRLAADGLVAREANLLRLPGHTVRVNDEEQQLVERVRAALANNAAAPPTIPELQAQIGVASSRLLPLIRVMERQRLIVRVGPDLFFVPEYLTSAEGLLRTRWREGEEITPAAFRDALGTSRKYAIPLLEYFDRAGVTERTAAGRRLKKKDAWQPSLERRS